MINCLLSSLQNKPSFLCISETWNNDEIVNSCTLDGYTSFHTHQPDKNKRGISIFICEQFIGTKIENLSICNDEIQSCAVKVQLNHEFILIIGIYRPHSGTVPNFIETLESFYEHPDFLNSRTVFIAGDFNINILNENNSNVINLCRLCSLNLF